MAMRAGRQRNQLPLCYYEGYLEKRSFKDKTSRKLWTSLCGSTLFFFNDKKDTDYIEKINLSGFISITDDGSWDRNLEAARFNLELKDCDIRFTAPNPEARELWKGYIHSVSQLCVPSSLNLLPGQIHILKEAVEKEKERVKTVSPPPPPPPPATSVNPYVSLQADMPSCYYNVSRLEAELLLEREAEKGNLLLRPGRHGSSFAVTTRQEQDSSIFRHYRVTRKPDGSFTIDVDVPVPCTTLHDVITYLLEKTDRVLIPLIMEEQYDKKITFICPDSENGETSVQCVAPNPVIPPNPIIPPRLPPKPVASREQTVEAMPEPQECLYMNDLPEEEEVKNKEDSPGSHPSRIVKNAPKKAILPPIPAPRRVSCPAKPSTEFQERPRSNTNLLVQAMSELKLTLEKRRTFVQ
ncbi:hypothetical protein LDENG_00149450 [Lucifuga dentata]|nr:hypothetical protein LDENG_00149450 [Lucifuga dentata]